MAKPRNDMSFQTPVVNKVTFEVYESFEGEAHLDFDDIILDVEIKTPQDKKTKEMIDNTCKTILTLRLGENKENFPFMINLEMESIFNWEDNVDIDIESYMQFHTPAIIYSYMRPIVTDLVTKAGFPAFNLPFMDFSNSDNIKKDIEK